MSSLPIAIVGIAAHLPSGPAAPHNLDHPQFFDFLLNKGQAYGPIPPDRFNIDAYHGSNVAQVRTTRGTFLKDTDMIDHVELGITAKDARSMSLSTRKLIELAFLALLDSGIDYRAQNVGCFASGIIFDVLSLSEPDEYEARGSFGGPPAMIANRISYHLDLTGPSVPVDTACSSSLTATHLAVQAIRAGDCPSAVVAGIQLNHRFVDWVQYSQGGILAPDGTCKPFDAHANGFARGEAGVAIVLKRLDHAIADNDHIYATILGTGINAAGSAAPVNAPVAAAQRDAMRRAWAQAGREPHEADYVELHATGTAAGDPTEANWVGDAFQRPDGRELLIGSVKGNIGHTEITAFLASLTKTIHIFRTGIIPPTVNLTTPNPAIGWEKYHLRAPVEPEQHAVSLVGLCSAGIGGANGHAVVAAPPQAQVFESAPEFRDPARPVLLFAGGLSPRTAGAVAEQISALVAEGEHPLSGLATTYARRARSMPWRSFAVYTPGQQQQPTWSAAVLAPRVRGSVALVFAGQGPQHVRMGTGLYAAYPVFRASVDALDAVYARATGESLLRSTGLFCGNKGASPLSDNGVWPIAVTLPALAILQCALVDLLASVGVQPAAVVGHSAGETAALYASGAGSAAMAVELAIARGRAMSAFEEAEGEGAGMAALACGPAEAARLIAAEDASGDVDVACFNTADAVTIAGPDGALARVVARAEQTGIMARRLRTRVPVHSALMDRIEKEYVRGIEDVFSRYPAVDAAKVPLFSTVTGQRMRGEERMDAAYFWAGGRQPVRFDAAVQALRAEFPGAAPLEVGPHPVLGSYLAALGAPSPAQGGVLRRPRRGEQAGAAAVEVSAFLGALGALAAGGFASVDWVALNGMGGGVGVGGGGAGWKVDGLPSYPFAPKRVPWHAESASFYRPTRARKGPLNGAGLRVGAGTHPVLAQHVVKGEPIMPAAGFLEMALEFGAVTLWDVEFRALLSLSAERALPVEVALDGARWAVRTPSRRGIVGGVSEEETFDRVHAEGWLEFGTPRGEDEDDLLDLDEVESRCERVDLANFYEELKTFAEYGPAFQRVIDVFQGEDEALVLVRGADDKLDIEGYCFHPAILDCCLHFMVHKSFTLSTDPNVYYLPSRVGRVVVHSPLVDAAFPDYVYAHIVFRAWTPETIVADFVIAATDGTRLCTLTDVEVSRHESARSVGAERRFDVALQPIAVPVVPEHERDVVVSGSEVDMTQLHAYLDTLARGVIATTLEKAPRTGADLDRKRYAKFAEAALASSPATTTKFDAETVREMERKWPEMIDITNRLASVHAKIFETSKAAVEVLYKDDVMTRFYKHYDWASKACAERFRGVLHSLVQAGKQVIRVLEVGSGTGALTRHLVDVMADFPAAVVEFVVSDVSKELLPRMAYPHCRYKAFDISKSAEEQGFEPSSFDVITGFDVLHVVPDMEPSLAQLNRLLVPGGTLLIGDLNGNGFAARSPGAVWFDFVFGSFAEWFSFTDGRKHCALSSDEWRARLGTAGFGNVVTAAFKADPLLFTLEARKVHEARPTTTLDNDKILFPYRRGVESELRAMVTKRDDSAPLSLWLYASAGFDGDAGAGVARSLGREYGLWDVHIVIFEGGASWSADSQREFVSALSNTRSSEAVLVVDAQGRISVPRVVPSKTPSGLRPFQPALPWVASASGSEVKQVSLPPKSEEFVTVQVLAMSPSENDLRAFVGRVAAADAEDELVVGVTQSPGLSNFVTVHQASVAALPSSFLDGLAAATSVADIAGAALGVAVGAVACGSSVLRSITAASTTRRGGHRRRQGGKVLLSRVGPVVGHSLRWLLQSLGFEIVEPKEDTPAGIAALGGKRSFDIVISGSSDVRAERQAYEHAVARNGKVFIWNDARSGLPALLKDDPVAVGEALEIAVERVVAAVGGGSRLPSAGGIKLDEVSLPQAGSPVPSSASLFDPAKAYILVGGIGGLGIRIALWMYEKGARYIVLTSRSGRDTLARVQDRLALRIVDYLESEPGLTIRLEASDATSHESTADLLRSIPVQLGGCMLLSVVLSDRMFASQDDKGFDKVFASKTGACRIFERCLVPSGGIASLDFFVAFSSVVGLFGNGGQTNYSGANTALDGIVREWDNAFTMVLPAISDSGGLASETRVQGGRLGHLTPWGMSAQRICDCLEDGLRKLADGPFWQYIPDLDWTLVQKYMGSAPSYSHLVESTTEDGPSGVVESGKSLKDVVLELLDVDESEFSTDVPFTAYGLDSLSAARLSLALRPHVAVSQLQLLSDISLSDLIARAEKSATQEQEEQQQQPVASPSNDKAGATNPRIAEIEEMIAKYSRSFKKHVGTKSSAESEVVLVTGTTGAIGTAVLAQLVSMPSVSRVYAFNRASTKGSSTLRERQASSLDARGYDSSILDGGKVVLVEGDQTVDGLGIPATLYEEIKDSVTSIIHNAWPVNFTSSLASLEPAVRSVRVMIDLALASSRKVPPRFLFLSTIGLFYNRTGTDSAAPEDRIADVNQVAGTGYSESKYVGERILEKAAEETPLRPVVVRAGQICGSPNGKWSTSEWFPSLVKSSIHLQCLPEMEGNVSWLPLQTAAEALVEMRNAENHTLHVSHPAPVAGSLVSNSLSKALGLPLVPYAEWVSRLLKSADETGPSQSNPALGLLEYFRSLEIEGVPCKEALGLPKLSVAEAVKVSPSLREAKSLTAEDVERWLAGWSRGGFIKSY